MKTSFVRPTWSAICLSLFGALAVVPETQSQGAAQTPALELVGVRVGMTQAEAEATLRKRGLRTTVVQGSFFENNSKFPAVIDGQTPQNDSSKPREIIRAMLAPPPNDPKVVVVSRHMIYGYEAGPEPATLISAMTEKFSKPARTAGTSSDQMVYWSWDDKGVTRPPDRRNHCSTMLFWFGPQGGMQNGPSGTSPTPGNIFSPALEVGCHRAILGRVQGGVRTSHYTSVAADFVALDAAMKRTAEHRVAIREAVNENARKDAAKVKPEI
jgi:hypothetical protein